MRAWFRRLAWRLVGILARLEIPPKTIPAPAYWLPYTIEESQAAATIQFLTASAKHFRVSVRYFRSAVILAGCSLKTVSICLCWRIRCRVLQARKSESQTSGIGLGGKFPFLKSDTRNSTASSIEKGDGKH